MTRRKPRRGWVGTWVCMTPICGGHGDGGNVVYAKNAQNRIQPTCNRCYGPASFLSAQGKLLPAGMPGYKFIARENK